MSWGFMIIFGKSSSQRVTYLLINSIYYYNRMNRDKEWYKQDI